MHNPQSIKKSAKTSVPIYEFADAINNNLVVGAIRRGLTLMIPFMIMGAFAIFINNLPIAPYQQFMSSLLGDKWQSFGGYVHQATFGIMSICVNISIGYALTENRKNKSLHIHPMIGALVSLVCLFVLIDSEGDILSWIGPLGVFVAIFTALTASKLHELFCGFKLFKIRIFSNAAESHFNLMLTSLFPAVCTVIVFVIFRFILLSFGISDIHTMLYDSLRNLFSDMSSKFAAGFGFVTLTHVSWFLGLHGNNVLEPVAQIVLIPALETNAALVAAGLPPTEIFTKQFFDVFVFLGGSGATLSLIIAIFAASRRSNTRKVAFISILPALMNVNEVMIFGVPIVLNFFLLIPFVAAPLVMTLIAYLATLFGLVPMTTVSVEWTTPIFIGGYIATGGSIAGVFLQLLNLAVGALVYLPFVRLYEKSLQRDNSRTLKALTEDVLAISDQRSKMLLDRKDSVGTMARALAGDLKRAIDGGGLTLHYQPLTMYDDTMFGVEALLRWEHNQLGFIPPPVIIAVAEDADYITELGKWIFKESMLALKEFSKISGPSFVMSVNITPSQLDDKSFAGEVSAIVRELGLDFHCVDIEVTEQAALGGIQRMNMLSNLRKSGFNIAMDDFGMGHGSLAYLKDMELDVIKIDGALVRELETNHSCRDIIATIIGLCKAKNIHVIAEYVENESQREILRELGCTCYQGFLYSPALPFQDACSYIQDFIAEKKTS